MTFNLDAKKTLIGVVVLLSIAFSPVALFPVFGQVSGGTLSGTVTDTSGAVIPGAQISIKNVATGVVREASADAAGFYTAPNLVPSTYEISVTAKGFSTQVQTGINLTVGAREQLNFTLRVGQTSETVQVVGGAPVVELTSSSIGAVVSSTEVRELPLNGRSWTDLAALQPGVATITTQAAFTVGPDRGGRGFGAQISISGTRPQQNNYRLDGLSMNDYANGAPGAVWGGNLGVDAIQEFSVLTTNYSAEYGKTAGGVINAITRSGTNQFHGSVYEFLRNSALDARNFFESSDTSKAPFRRNQFGAAGGGPIQKDRTFIFGDYEGIRQVKGVPSARNVVPSAAARLGNLCSNLTPPIGSPGDCTPTTIPVDPSAQKYLVFFPSQNGGLVPGGDGNTAYFNYIANQIVSENFFTIRVDRKFSDKDSVFGSYLFDRANYSFPSQLDAVLLGDLTFRQLVTVEETHIFSPNLVNTIRVGFNRDYVDDDKGFSAINPAATDTSLGAEPGRPAAGVSISGLRPGFSGGLGADSVFLFRWNSFQAYDDAFLTRGTHSVKFGGGVERMQLNEEALNRFNGLFSFGSLQAFLTNHPHQYQAGIPSTLSERGWRYTYAGAYVQDDWHLRRNVTVNLGLRYEMITVPSEVHGKYVNLVNITDALPRCGVLVAGCGSTGPFFRNPTLRDFAPRVGMAWDPFRNGKTAVRAGFGLFDSLPLPYEFTLANHVAYPFFAIGNVSGKKLPAGSFFAGASQLLAAGFRSTHTEQNPHRNYVMQWNGNIQQEITPSLVAMVGYIGSRGVHMPFRVDSYNMVIPTLTSAGYLFPAPVGTGTKINPNFGRIDGLFYDGDSYYDGLVVGVTKKMSHGIQFQTSYTWGKSIDNNSAAIAGDQFSNGVSSLSWYDMKLSRAVSDFNVGRTLIINVNWQVPTAQSLSGLAARIVNGWELGAIFKANDGVPFTPTWGTGGDPSGTNSADDYAYPNRLTGPGCASLTNPGNINQYIKTQCFTLPTAPNMAFWQANCDTTSSIYGQNLTTEPFPVCFNLRGNAGRNIIVGPGIENLDFSVFKNNYVKRISESFNVQFRAEFFNILNHPNFGDPVIPNGEADIFDATGTPNGSVGKLNTTSTPERQIQFALKFIW